MGKRDSFEELKKGALERFKKSLLGAKEATLTERFPPFGNRGIKEIKSYTELLDELEGLLLLTVNGFLKNLPPPSKKEGERSLWEVYLSGLRYFARRYPQGFFRGTTLSPKEYEDFPNKLDSFIYKCSEGLIDIVDLSKELERYCRHHKNGLDVVQKHEGWHPDWLKMYASLKTWEDDDKFQVFENRLLRARQQIFDIIVEGPIQLYLVIGQETWFIILKILTLRDLRDFYSDQNKEELRDLKALNELIYKTVEGSESLEAFKKLGQECLRIWVNDFLEEEKRNRRQCPTEGSRKRFIERFENEEIFRS